MGVSRDTKEKILRAKRASALGLTWDTSGMTKIFLSKRITPLKIFLCLTVILGVFFVVQPTMVFSRDDRNPSKSFDNKTLRLAQEEPTPNLKALAKDEESSDMDYYLGLAFTLTFAVRHSRCCCFSARTGTLILAFLGVIGSTFSLVRYGMSYARMDDIDRMVDELVSNLEANAQDPDYEEIHHSAQMAGEFVKGLLPTLLIMGLVCASISMLKNVLLWFGVVYRKQVLVLPWLILVMISLVGDVLVVFIVGIVFFVHFNAAPALIFWAVATPCLALGFYFWTVVQSHYLDIKETKEDQSPFMTLESPPGYEKAWLFSPYAIY
eukprot:snap_masked-scaffold477_size161254-processed-gene-0.1 protein:Tk07234 transcript:snap_masked-scaffold477_size161254-processed-gene-0.1-mRNA-1 annotation:"PREDICTED: uncharacterized protein LOC103512912 isoform X1"